MSDLEVAGLESGLYCGPQFPLAEEQWPTNQDSSEELSEQDDPKFKMGIFANAVTAKEENDSGSQLIDRVSSWNRLKRVMG